MSEEKSYIELNIQMLKPCQIRKLGDIPYSEFLDCPSIGQARFGYNDDSICLTITLGRKLTKDYLEFMDDIGLTRNHLYVWLGQFYEMVIPHDAVNLLSQVEDNEWETVVFPKLSEEFCINGYYPYSLSAVKVGEGMMPDFCHLNVAMENKGRDGKCLVVAENAMPLDFHDLRTEYSAYFNDFLIYMGYDMAANVGDDLYLLPRKELEAILEILEMEPYLERNLRGIIREPKQVQAHRKNHRFE